MNLATKKLLTMSHETIEMLNEIIADGGFPAKVAQTVLSTGRCSDKQADVLMLDYNGPEYAELTGGASTGYDPRESAKFEEWNNNNIRQAMQNHL